MAVAVLRHTLHPLSRTIAVQLLPRCSGYPDIITAVSYAYCIVICLMKGEGKADEWLIMENSMCTFHLEFIWEFS